MFALFSSLALVSASLVIRTKNPVHSVFFLILVFCNTAGLLVLLGLDLFAMILLIVYVGAIAVLFLFVVMMLNIKIAEIQDNVLRYLPIGILFLLEVILIVDIPSSLSDSLLNEPKTDLALRSNLSSTIPGAADPLASFGLSHSVASLSDFPPQVLTYTAYATKVNSWSNIESIGNLLYTTYSLYFLLASIILLVAMIGAIVLTGR